MICEKCNQEHDGSYGSGRFCSKSCAKSFASGDAEKRLIKNNKIRAKLKGRDLSVDAYGHSGISRRSSNLLNTLDADWESLTDTRKRLRVLVEQNGECSYCELSVWNGIELVLEYHHIDGNRSNSSRENVEYLCPNCHSQTEGYRFKGHKHTKNNKIFGYSSVAQMVEQTAVNRKVTGSRPVAGAIL